VQDTLYTLEESYAMRPGGGFNPTTQGVVCDLLFGAAIDIFHDPSRCINYTGPRAVVAETMIAVRLAGPNLGITQFRAQRVGPALRTTRHSEIAADPNLAGVIPLVTSISLPILVRTQTSDLLA
jgi:hypothetical protein